MKKNIIIGVCGSIAAYKVCEIVREFKKTGWDVKVIITEEGRKFVTPLTPVSYTHLTLPTICSV